MTASPIRCTIDLDAPGSSRQAAGAALVEQSGWSNQYVPIVSVARGEGPTALVMGGVHGDEPEGQVARRTWRELRPRAGQRARDRDPVRLDRRVARLHALAVGREHEPLVPGLADGPARTSSSRTSSRPCCSRARTSSSTSTRGPNRSLPAVVGDALGRRRRTARPHGGRDAPLEHRLVLRLHRHRRHGAARRRGRAAGEDRGQHRARRRRPRHRRDPPPGGERPAERPAPLRDDRGRARDARGLGLPSRSC